MRQNRGENVPQTHWEFSAGVEVRKPENDVRNETTLHNVVSIDVFYFQTPTHLENT